MTVCRWFLIIFLRNLCFVFFFNLVQLPKCLAKLDALELPNLYIDDSVKERVHLFWTSQGKRTHTSLSFCYCI